MKFIKEPQDLETLYPLVVKECELIKQHFPEVSNLFDLEIEEFDTTHKKDCIYGKMIGDCNDNRVTKFIDDNLQIVIKGDALSSAPYRTVKYMTPLEVYIYGYDRGDELESNNEAKERLIKVLNLLK